MSATITSILFGIIVTLLIFGMGAAVIAVAVGVSKAATDFGIVEKTAVSSGCIVFAVIICLIVSIGNTVK